MGKKLTTEEFIEKARKIHGDKYDYSKVVYVHSQIKVCIICPTHGEFWQTPHNHLSGNGCQECYGNKRNTVEQFIKKAREVHGDKYEYSKVEYKSTHKKVCIVCPTHGDFEQEPNAHLRGQGCPKCGTSSRIEKQMLGREQFIEKACEVHGNKYDYSKVEYVNWNTKVCIICPEHGEFWQTSNNHLHFKGCPKCGNESIGNSLRKTREQFIEEAKNVHGDKYDYSKVEYIDSQTKVCIICPTHGEFWQKPNDHLRGNGCQRCRNSKLETDIDNYLNENNITHEPQKTFDWLKYKKPLRLDFYMPQYNVAVECQGAQHFEEVDVFGGKQGLKVTIKRDILKKQLCEQHGIKLLYYADEKPTNWDKYDVITDKETLLKEIKGD